MCSTCVFVLPSVLQHILLECFDFCRAMRCISAAYAVIRCTSVCLSVTFVGHVKTNKRIFEIFSPSGSHTNLVFPHQTGWRYSDGIPLTGASNARRGMKKMTIFDRSIWEMVIVRWAHAARQLHRILFPSIQHLAWLPQGRPQGKPKCGKDSDFCTYALT